jgi:quercetin 2,3-dioxygenase
MDRRRFIKGSAIIGATVAVPDLLKASSGLESSRSARGVYRLLNANKSMVGTLPVLRAFAGDHNDYVSPFVFFDEFGPLKVEAHPHAGIAPTTYFLEGSGHHRDSLNYDFQISKGDFMLFTAGKGAIHMEETGEMLYNDGGIYHGFQIWLNLPAKYKYLDPSTQLFHPGQMAKLEKEDYTAHIVMGEMFGVKSSVDPMFPVFYFHIKMKAGCKLEIPIEPTHNAFAYVIKGSVETEGRVKADANQVILFERNKDDVMLFSGQDAEILLCGGQPHNEPVFAYGPFVMNNEEQIRRCFADYQAGRMGDPYRVNGN